MPYPNGNPRNLWEVLGNTADDFRSFYPGYMQNKQAEKRYDQEQDYQKQRDYVGDQRWNTQFDFTRSQAEAARGERMKKDFYDMASGFAGQGSNAPNNLEEALTQSILSGDEELAAKLRKELSSKNSWENRAGASANGFAPNVLSLASKRFSELNTGGYAPGEPEYNDLREQALAPELSYLGVNMRRFPGDFQPTLQANVDSLRSAFGLRTTPQPQPRDYGAMARTNLDRSRAFAPPNRNAGRPTPAPQGTPEISQEEAIAELRRRGLIP